jgi:hypothetical protein
MPGPWKEWKSKSSFPTLSTAPWKSRKRREIPTFPQPGFATAVLTSNQENQKEEEEEDDDDDDCAAQLAVPAFPTPRPMMLKSMTTRPWLHDARKSSTE